MSFVAGVRRLSWVVRGLKREGQSARNKDTTRIALRQFLNHPQPATLSDRSELPHGRSGL